jgi:tritrans,polycis-undecaprenyl-diphosphate synthase [geranylgeranyl-diphosphate specific]
LNAEELLRHIHDQPDGVPRHVGVILDGNRRWAKQNKLALLKGYEVGARRADDLCRWAMGADIRMLSLWTWSTENFGRPQDQVKGMMDLFRYYLKRYLESGFLEEHEIRFRVVGKVGLMPDDIQRMAHELEDKTRRFDKMILNGCIAYGGRQEVVDACRDLAAKVAAGTLAPEEISVDLLNAHMYYDDLAADLIIRTGGDRRTSGYLLWHTDYSEWYFVDKLFPDLTEEDFLSAILDYQRRERRFGK